MTRRVLWVGVVLALLLAACGGGGQPTARSSRVTGAALPTATDLPPTPTALPTSTPTPRPTPTATRPAPTRPAATPLPALGNTVYDPTGRCRLDLPAPFVERTPGSGYFPASDRSGFVGLDAHALAGGTRSRDDVVNAALRGVHALVVDYGQSAANWQGDTLRVAFTGGLLNLNGQGTVYFRQFGDTICQLTFFVLDIAPQAREKVLDPLIASLQLVDPAQPRPGGLPVTPPLGTPSPTVPVRQPGGVQPVGPAVFALLETAPEPW